MPARSRPGSRPGNWPEPPRQSEQEIPPRAVTGEDQMHPLPAAASPRHADGAGHRHPGQGPRRQPLPRRTHRSLPLPPGPASHRATPPSDAAPRPRAAPHRPATCTRAADASPVTTTSHGSRHGNVVVCRPLGQGQHADPVPAAEEASLGRIPAVSAVSTDHGRQARRTIKAALAPAWIGFEVPPRSRNCAARSRRTEEDRRGRLPDRRRQ